MNRNNLDQALAALGDALKSQEPGLNPKDFVKKIPLRSLSGDHITGGKITNFSSQGIIDKSASEQIVIQDDLVTINNLSVKQFIGTVEFKKPIITSEITSKMITTEVIKADKIIGEISFEKDKPIRFSKEHSIGNGIIWESVPSNKQLVLQSNPDRLFSTETIDVGRGKHFSINGVKIVDEKELGPTITKSNLKQLGRLQGLIVDGSVSINQYLYYDGTNDRLGLGTDSPRCSISILENNSELSIGTRNTGSGIIGTFSSHALDIITDNTSRIAISSNGNIELGNKNSPPIQVSINGKLSVNVATPDSRASLHVAGAIKFNDKLHLSGNAPPKDGNHNVGDIIWNSEPSLNKPVGWVCIGPGAPGRWASFGTIK